jgi:hypothetical protein
VISKDVTEKASRENSSTKAQKLFQQQRFEEALAQLNANEIKGTQWQWQQ